MQGLNNNLYKFSHLRNLQLFMNIDEADADKILCLVFFLSTTPLIEILEVHVSAFPDSYHLYIWFPIYVSIFSNLKVLLKFENQP